MRILLIECNTRVLHQMLRLPVCIQTFTSLSLRFFSFFGLLLPLASWSFLSVFPFFFDDPS